MADPKKPSDGAHQNRILGSLRDALLAAGRPESDAATERKAPPPAPMPVYF